jgi:hypothetical protein
VAKLEIERQKEIMQEKERLIQAFIKVFKEAGSREGKIGLTAAEIKSVLYVHTQIVKQKNVKVCSTLF